MLVTLFHPHLPGVVVRVPPAAVDAWTDSGWLNSDPPADYQDHAIVTAAETSPGVYSLRATIGGNGTEVARFYGLTPEQTLPELAKADLAKSFIPAAVDAADTQARATKRLRIDDTPGAKGSVLDIEHWGNGSGGTNNQTYGLDIHNNPGSRMGLVGHQYSNNGSFAQLDNTDSGTMILIKNTNNPVRNPGGAATGDSATGDALRLVNNTGGLMYAVKGRGEVIINSGTSSTPGQTTHSLEIVTGTTGTYRAAMIRHNNPTTGLEIISSATTAGFYSFNISAQSYGANIVTATNGGAALQLTKNGTGAGSGLIVTNKGTGAAIGVRDAAELKSAILSNGEFEHYTAGAGIVLRSPNGTRYRVTVSDTGALSASAA